MNKFLLIICAAVTLTSCTTYTPRPIVAPALAEEEQPDGQLLAGSDNAYRSGDSIPGTEVITHRDFSLILPAGWESKRANGTTKVFLVGNGKGFPASDESGPVEVGLAVDKYRADSTTFEEFAQESLANLRKDESVRILNTRIVKECWLSDGTKASLLVVLLAEKPKERHLQIKLTVKGRNHGDWIVTAWLIGSPKSSIVSMGSPAMVKMLGHLSTLVFDQETLDGSRIEKFYEEAPADEPQVSSP